MSGRKGKSDDKPGVPEWMCTFADMMSLLLCFFVLLFSLSTLEIIKFEQTMSSVQGALGRIPNLFESSFIPPISANPQKVEPVQRQKDLERAKEAIAEKARSKLVADEPSREVIVEGVKEGVRISMTGRVLFEAGGVELSEEGESILRILAEEILNDFPNLRVRIEGHSDNTPISPGAPFPNNWRLAEGRAFTVMTFLRDSCDVREDRMSYMSSGEYRPRFPNDTPEERALNRRVEIVLLQGQASDTIMGRLEGAGEPKIAPDESLFIPRR